MPQTPSADSNPRSESLSSSQDIVGRLRTAMGLDLSLKREAADEIERLRGVADKRGEIAVERRREIERLRMTPDELRCLQQILLVNSVKCLDPLREFMQRQVSPQENSTADGEGFSRAGKDGTKGPRCGSKCTGRDSGSPTLTDAERSAIADAADRYAEITPESRKTVAALRGLLERLGGGR